MKEMNGIDRIFQEKEGGILSVYFTAGYPQLNDTQQIIFTLQDCGVDFLEVGIPFSDPVADGETIQMSSQAALNNGMTVSTLFDQLDEIKSKRTVPLIMMGYLNPILQYGVETFCQRCQMAGVDGLIIPDLPLLELQETYHDLFQQYELKNILLITPQTPEVRMKKLDELSTGFNYVVSSASTTGKTNEISPEQRKYLQRIQNADLRNPLMVGFGINNKKGFDTACRYAQGAIIGSAFIKALSGGNLEENIREFINSIRS